MSTLSCPKCRSAMSGEGTLRASRYGKVELDWCSRCIGIFFDKGEIERVRKGPSFGDALADATGGPGSDSVASGLFAAVTVLLDLVRD